MVDRKAKTSAKKIVRQGNAIKTTTVAGSCITVSSQGKPLRR
jgi:hypothetical protein